eukprot:355040-Chlamydomonas_euryale.AAC.12
MAVPPVATAKPHPSEMACAIWAYTHTCNNATAFGSWQQDDRCGGVGLHTNLAPMGSSFTTFAELISRLPADLNASHMASFTCSSMQGVAIRFRDVGRRPSLCVPVCSEATPRSRSQIQSCMEQIQLVFRLCRARPAAGVAASRSSSSYGAERRSHKAK